MITINDKQFTAAVLTEDGETVLQPSFWMVTASIESASGSARTGEKIDGPEDMTDAQIKAEIGTRWGIPAKK